MIEFYRPGELVFRKYREEDVVERFKAIEETKAELSKWYNCCHPGYSDRENRKWIKNCARLWRLGKEYSFKITDSLDIIQFGECRINHINDMHKLANIFYWVRADYEGRGIASQATRMLAQFGFRELNLNRLEIFMSLRNIASQKMAEKASAKKEGILRNRINLRGRIEDAVLCWLIPEDIL